MRMITARVPALLLAGFLAGCTANPSKMSETSSLEGTAWILSALPGQTLLPEAGVTLRFEGGKASGSDGCNRYSAPYTSTGQSLEISPRGISTMMACPPELMQLARSYTTALGDSRAWRIEDGRLQLLAADGRTLAMLAAQPASLAGTSWRVTAINNGRQAVVSVVSGSKLTLSFTADGQASGSAGCNRYHTRYQADAAQLRFQAPAATRMMCPGEGLMEQEQAFLKALSTVASVRHEGNRLELRTADGALAVTLVREERE
jgi:heat shock protein HslJ